MRELAAAFHVSEATIRQDLERLENEGFITREHGSAYLNSVAPQIGTMTLHHQENMDKKRKIGALAAGLVKDGETLILDAGTTTTEIAMRLTNRRNLTLITNALNCDYPGGCADLRRPYAGRPVQVTDAVAVR